MPIKMYYETQKNKLEVLVYHFHITETEPIDCLVTAYDTTHSVWITAPISYFEPILNEEDSIT